MLRFLHLVIETAESKNKPRGLLLLLFGARQR